MEYETGKLLEQLNEEIQALKQELLDVRVELTKKKILEPLKEVKA
jgi:ribosomal protein L29|tara:strand:+ start:291 stop:425 length:135 start_codon:yes stop_codon:yes gene_type:complete